MDVEQGCTNNLGLNLRILRVISGRSQADVARELQMSRSNYVNIEAGLRDTSIADARLIEQMTRMSMDTLIHADFRVQMQRYLRGLSYASDIKSFVEAYSMLSYSGRLNVAMHLDRLLETLLNDE